MLKVFIPCLPAFQELMEKMLEAELGIQRYMTYIVTREVKTARPDLARLMRREPGPA